jgi:hypothetical protein
LLYRKADTVAFWEAGKVARTCRYFGIQAGSCIEAVRQSYPQADR